MSISMMYQFENNFFFPCLPNSSIFLFYPPPPPNKILALHLWKYTKQRKSKFSLIKFKP